MEGTELCMNTASHQTNCKSQMITCGGNFIQKQSESETHPNHDPVIFPNFLVVLPFVRLKTGVRIGTKPQKLLADFLRIKKWEFNN